MLVAVTLAPTIAAPELSRTEPTIDPPLICAHDSLTSSSDIAAAQSTSFDKCFISGNLHPHLIPTYDYGLPSESNAIELLPGGFPASGRQESSARNYSTEQRGLSR